jgi:hypothetical protein
MPDIENIMYISDLFNVSLDTIVKGDKEMVTKIISDNKNIKFVSKILIGLLITAIAVIAFILSIGGMVSYTFDPIAIIIMVFFPLLFQYVMYGKFSLTAFSIISNRKKKGEDAWKKAEDFFNNYAAVLWLTAILILSIHFIMLLRFLENKAGLGPNLFFMANIIITAGLINLVIVIPYKIKIKQHFIQMEFSSS